MNVTSSSHDLQPFLAASRADPCSYPYPVYLCPDTVSALVVDTDWRSVVHIRRTALAGIGPVDYRNRSQPLGDHLSVFLNERPPLLATSSLASRLH